jgi:alpha-L-arabinofuranosidase
VRLQQRPDGWYVALAADPRWAAEQPRKPITTELLGKAKVPNLPYENPDATPLAIDTDYFGQKRPVNPFPGPIEIREEGKRQWKVWPLAREEK